MLPEVLDFERPSASISTTTYLIIYTHSEILRTRLSKLHSLHNIVHQQTQLILDQYISHTIVGMHPDFTHVGVESVVRAWK